MTNERSTCDDDDDMTTCYAGFGGPATRHPPHNIFVGPTSHAQDPVSSASCQAAAGIFSAEYDPLLLCYTDHLYRLFFASH